MHANLHVVMPEEPQIEVTAETFRMLADPTRIRLLSALAQGEQSVSIIDLLLPSRLGETQ